MYSPRSEIPTKEKNSLRKRKYMYQLVILHRNIQKKTRRNQKPVIEKAHFSTEKQNNECIS